ncbi:MAG: prepilin-type N-terminal cleavage/methylation domain-containing protein [Candidatus Cloacimonetes bacterium]|nr:prepilin-type N-terminal cleavage/methylation domain-containing protein [Candidatus Cloacimonadota bacterium]
MFKSLNNQKGFTLVEILVVVIIVAILAAIAVPTYMRYVEQARSSEAQAALSSIRTAFRIYRQTYGTTEGYQVEDALKDAKLGNATEKRWTFEAIGNPPNRYVATSTADFPAGEGKQVMYDEKEAKFHGYGIDEWTDEQEDF